MFMNRDDRRVLRALFGHRVSFHEAERRLYETDLWRPPVGVRRFVRSMPEAVVLPENETELVELVGFANEVGIPLVPRGGGTALNGGSMPVRGGIVVDFAHMDQRFEPSAQGSEVLVGAGMTFASLSARLAAIGQAPLVEPVFPETTVGGWLATGGPGFGSNRFGFFEDTVRFARVVLPDGTRRVFSGSELEVVSSLCGSTGLISSVTLRTRALERPVPFLASFADLGSLDGAFDEVRNATRWWSLSVEPPETAAMKAEALGQKAPARNAFLLMGAALPGDWDEAGQQAVTKIVEKAGGKVVDAKKTKTWWDAHDRVYQAKSLGPSMHTGSVLVPSNVLPQAIARLHRAVKAPHWLMSALVAGDQTLLTGYALDDERRPPHEVGYGAVLAMEHALKKLGGRPVSLGVKAAGQASRFMNEDRLDRVIEFKNAVDHNGIMNPGKVFGTPIARLKPSWAPGPSVQAALRPGEPLLRAMHGSTYVRYQRREEARAPYKAGLSAALGAAGAGGFGAKWAWPVIASDVDTGLRHASASARAFGSLGSSPLGWLGWVGRYISGDATFSEYQYRALAGEGIAAEAEVRSRFGLAFADLLMELKAQMLEEGFRPLKEHRAIRDACLEHHNEYGRDNVDRTAWADGLELADKSETLVFVDDTVSFEAPRFANLCVRLLQGAGQNVTYLGEKEHASGQVLLASGQMEAAETLFEHNAKAVKESGAKVVITLDPWTHHVLSRLYPRMASRLGVQWDVEVRHVYEVLAKHADAGKISAPKEQAGMVLHHPPVFLLHGIDEAMAATALGLMGIKATPLVHHGEQAMDVGASGAVRLVYPEIATLASRRVLRDAASSDAGHLVSSDPASGLILAASRDRLDENQTEGVPAVFLLGADVPAQAAKEAGANNEDEGEGDETESGSSKDEDEAEQAAQQAA